nr:CST complex subunit CTC1 [Pogona vitticeps]
MEAPFAAAVGMDFGPGRAFCAALEHHWLRAMQGSGGTDQPPVDAAWQCLMRAQGPCTSSSSSKDLLHGYSLVSISELQSQQRMPCCSHLTWSSDEFNRWVRQGERVLPEQRILQRTHLILFGYLTDEGVSGKDKLVDGSLYLRDNTGMLPCVVLHFKLEWLGLPLLFPGWVYIPQSGQNTGGGYVEILGDPVHVTSAPTKTIDSVPVFYPGLAAQLLGARPQCKKKATLNVAGELFRLSRILCIHQKTFFFLFLKASCSAACVPVLVQNPPQLVWHHALQLGCWYILTNLKVACLKTSGLKVFLTCSSSDLLPYCAEHVREQFLDAASKGSVLVSASPTTCVPPGNLLELEEDEKMLVPVRESKMISCTGTITQVLNAQAGLFELDNKYTLCLAYQPLLNSGRGLRSGACVELRDVHLLQDPLTASLPVLGACLRSTVVLKSFSRYSTLHQPVTSFGNLYIQLLLQYNLSLSLYLQVVHLLETFEQRFCYFIQRYHAVGAAEMFMVPLLNSLVLSKGQERNIHQEILAETHHCPIEQAQMSEMPCQIPPFSLLHSMLDKKCWETFNPRQQLSSAAETQSMCAQELNRGLAWSYSTLSAESFEPRMVLLGALECSRRGCLQLRDRTKALPCVIFHRDGRPFADTSLIGCLLQIETFQLVMERFLQSDFPSWQELESHEYIKEKKTRFYVQFCFEDMKILHAPENRVPGHLKAAESTSSGVKDDDMSEAEPRAPERNISDKGRAIPDIGTLERAKSEVQKASSVSRLFLVTQKEGLLERNYQEHSEDKRAAREAHLCFQATVQWMSQPKLGGELGDPGGQQELGQEEASEGQQKVLLVFRKKLLHWFSFLHPDHVYQLILPECSDLDVFDKLCVPLAPGRLLNLLSCSFFLFVPDNAYLHHVSQVSQLVSPVSKMKQKEFSIAEILSPSFTESLASFSGEVMERSLCESPLWKKSATDCSLKKKGNLSPWCYTVKLSVSPTAGSPALLDVYVGPAFLPDLWGMLPGARILFQNQERKISRSGKVYCNYVASSYICVLAPPPKDSSSDQPSSTSILSGVYLFNIALQPPGLCQIQVKCHVKCVLSLSLHAICSLCSSSFTQGRCNQNNAPCLSRTAVIKASARILIEDGTSEFVVLCRNQQVQQVLGLSPKEWNDLQIHVRTKDRVCIYNSASSGPGGTEEHEDVLTWYLRSLCRSPVVCRTILLTCQLDRKPSEVRGTESLRRFLSNEVEFLSQTRPRQVLICLNIQEAT